MKIPGVLSKESVKIQTSNFPDFSRSLGRWTEIRLKSKRVGFAAANPSPLDRRGSTLIYFFCATRYSTRSRSMAADTAQRNTSRLTSNVLTGYLQLG